MTVDVYDDQGPKSSDCASENKDDKLKIQELENIILKKGWTEEQNAEKLKKCNEMYKCK